MTILNFTLLLIIAFASMSSLEGLKCLRCEGEDPECKSTTTGMECKGENPVCLMAIFKGTLVKTGTEIARYCIPDPSEYSLGCTLVTSEPKLTITNCFCNKDNCDPKSASGSAPITGETGKSAGLTLTPSIPASLSIIISIIAATFYKIQ